MAMLGELHGGGIRVRMVLFLDKLWEGTGEVGCSVDSVWRGCRTVSGASVCAGEDCIAGC